MKVIREFEPADRYVYDFGMCSYANGFAQIDNVQDAPYFGTWVNPWKMIIVNYCEGDVTTTVCESPQEFASEVRRIVGLDGYKKIDPGLSGKFEKRFMDLGLSDCLYEQKQTIANVESGLLSNLIIGGLVDDDIINHFLCAVPPIKGEGFIQLGEPYTHDDKGIPIYPTVEKIGIGWIYTGIKQNLNQNPQERTYRQ